MKFLYIVGCVHFENMPETLDSRFVLKSLSIAALLWRGTPSLLPDLSK